MASLVRRSRKRGGVPCDFWAVEFACPLHPRARRTLYLGFVRRGDAERNRVLIADILSRWNSSMPLENALLSRVRELPAGLQHKYQRLGLVPAKSGPKSLAALTTAFLSTQHFAKGTRIIYIRTIQRLHDFFGEARDIAGIKVEDAAAWRAWLFTKQATTRKKSLAEQTVSKHVSQAKTIFKWATDMEWLSKSPFRSIRSGPQVNEARNQRISRDTVERVIASCENAELRAMLGLARYGGLRMPSEAVGLEWSQVNLQRGHMFVFAPKTGRKRKVPLCRRLRQLLAELQNAASTQDPRLFPMLRPDTNLRTRLIRAIRRAGVPVWCKLWQNLRSSRLNDWVESKRDLKEVGKWMGHSLVVMLKHYRTSNGDDFERAVEE